MVAASATTGSVPGARSTRARMGYAAVHLSRVISVAEKAVVGTLILGIFVLILINVATRAAGRPLIWVDELAIYLMVAACFIGTSLTVRQRLDFAVTFLPDLLNSRHRRWVDGCITTVGLGYALFLVWCSWRMFDPITLARHGFNVSAYTADTLNFLYTDPTVTLGIPKWIIYLVLPVYALGLTIHCTANLVEDLGWVERSVPAVDPTTVELG
jgi:TRAP-type C4-dicarboxylate transport system permease small subunit